MNALLPIPKPSACQTYAADVSKNNGNFSNVTRNYLQTKNFSHNISIKVVKGGMNTRLRQKYVKRRHNVTKTFENGQGRVGLLGG